jgi:glutaredoxin/glutathione-dependent peroxiredoxin
MTIAVGDTLPGATMLRMGEKGPETVDLAATLKGRKVVLFALPGAYTGTCSTVHMPSFIRTAERFRAKGVDEIICVAVNDPFALHAWGETTGAAAAGIAILGDSDGSFTKSLGMAFDAPAIGLFGRSNRYAAVVEDGVVTHVQIDKPGECNISTGEALLDAV